MGVETTRYVRKPLYVEAVRVSPKNIEELAEWCDGKIDMGYPNPHGTGKKKKYIKVNVLNPRNPRQTMAFIGDWLLRQGDSFKIYTFKAFEMAFDLAEEDAATQSEQETTFYIDPTSGDLTEDKPGKHAQPLSASELAEIVRNELVVTYENSNVVKEEPLPPQPRNVGGNIEIQDKRDHGAATGADPEFEGVQEPEIDGVPQAEPGSDLMDPPPPGGDMFPPESPEMKEARETIEAEGGTVEPATPEGIATAAQENEQARAAVEVAEEGIAEMVEEQIDPALQPQPVVEEVPNSEGVAVESSPTSPPVDPAEGKRVLSENEQKVLGPDEVRKLVISGDVVLAQDLVPAEQA